jgi:hypothetical protein
MLLLLLELLFSLAKHGKVGAAGAQRKIGDAAYSKLTVLASLPLPEDQLLKCLITKICQMAGMHY